MKYIDADKLNKKLSNKKVEALIGPVGVAYVKSLIKESNVQNAKKEILGKWVEGTGGNMVCSVCRSQIKGVTKRRYCGFCGAKMIDSGVGE